MIQDLAPLHFDNAYHNVQPEEKDIVISLRQDQILLAGEKNGIRFPVFGDLPEQYCSGHTFTYLFSIGESHFFLCHDLELEGFRYEKMAYLRRGGPQHLIYAGLVAMQLGRWYDAHRFCGRCGTPMIPDERERMMRCPSCGQMEYPKICPCVIVGVIHDGKILVSQYRGGFTDRYALIAGFAEVGETIEETVAREVYEETHLHVKNLRYYKCQPWPFSESLLFGFYCELDGPDEIIIEEEELAMAKWVTPEEIFEKPDNFSLTNEMLCKFRDDYGKDGFLHEAVF